jgi:hypothetical protein
MPLTHPHALLPDPVDNQPLHRYRVTRPDHEALGSMLRHGLASGARSSLSAQFVLWAAEHFRLTYDGGTLSWERLIEPLGTRISQSELRDMTQRGLGYFKRTRLLKSEAGTQYLRSLAAEGGIPAPLLSGDGAWVVAITGLVTDIDPFGPTCPDDLAQALANARTVTLPMGYRTVEFQSVFANFAREIVGLRAQLGAFAQVGVKR